MRWFFCVIVFVFVTGCNQNTTYKPSTKQKLANKIRKTAALQIQKKTEMHPSGIGGQMMDEIKMLALSFDHYQSISIEESRKLLITAVNEFLDVINSDEKIRPYLNNYPFEPKNIEIRIFLRNPDGSNIALGKLVVVSAIDGILKYKIDNLETNLFTTVHKETYEEALQKIEGNSNKAA